MSFLAHLSDRLTSGEELFFAGQLEAADSTAEDVLRDLASLMSKPGVSGAAARQLTPQAHQCAHGCVCRAAVLLHLQCAAELGRGPEAIDRIVTTYYGKTRNLPYNIFRVWIEYHLSLQHYEQCCRELVSYIDAHYATSGGTNMPSSSLLPSAIEEDSSESEGGSADARYVKLIELLLFHCLVPLGSHDEAIAFLRKGRRAKRNATGAPAPHVRDERIAPEVKEAWLNELLDLQAAGFTHAVASAKQLVAAAESRSAQVVPVPPSTSFYAGLAALHDSTAYTAESTSEQLQLPPANLPEAGYIPIVHRAGSGNEDGDPDEIARRTAAAESDRIIAEADLRSSALIPYPLPLQPLIPQPFEPNFLWTSWSASMGHRVYALLHRVAPRTANRMRVMAHWLWSRRALWASLVLLYLALRVLSALLRFFRLADLPGVRLLIQEARKFVQIAFLTGSGRSLFA